MRFYAFLSLQTLNMSKNELIWTENFVNLQTVLIAMLAILRWVITTIAFWQLMIWKIWWMIMSSRRLQNVFSVTIFRLPRRLQGVFGRSLQDVLEDVKLLRWRRVEDFFKTYLEDVLKTSWRRQQMFAGNVLNVEYCRTRKRLIMEKFPSMLTYYFLSGEMIWSSYELVQLNEAYNIWSLKYEGGF